MHVFQDRLRRGRYTTCRNSSRLYIHTVVDCLTMTEILSSAIFLRFRRNDQDLRRLASSHSIQGNHLRGTARITLDSGEGTLRRLLEILWAFSRCLFSLNQLYLIHSLIHHKPRLHPSLFTTMTTAGLISAPRRRRRQTTVPRLEIPAVVSGRDVRGPSRRVQTTTTRPARRRCRRRRL